MKIPSLLALLAGISELASASQIFAGSNLYYAAGLTSSQQDTLLSGLQDAGVKVLRVWLDGQSGTIKGTTIDSFNSLQSSSPSSYDDTVLNRLDDFMAKAKNYGVKLMISMHSYNTLEAHGDFYGQWYGTGDFYTDPNAIQYFKERIAHVLAHVNPHNGKTWGNSPEYIFAFEAQNEAMHDNSNVPALEQWQCTMATAIKDNMNGSSDILVTTGGGAYVDASLPAGYFTCDALDVLAIHAYGVGDFSESKLQPYVQKAQDNGKKLIMQEWGACYFDTSNNRCNPSSPLASGTRDDNIGKWAQTFNEAGIPWMYWQILPNEDPHQDWDYEIGIGGKNWDTLKSVAKGAAGYGSAFDFSKWL